MKLHSGVNTQQWQSATCVVAHTHTCRHSNTNVKRQDQEHKSKASELPSTAFSLLSVSSWGAESICGAGASLAVRVRMRERVDMMDVPVTTVGEESHRGCR